jgi:hypothetical protein
MEIADPAMIALAWKLYEHRRYVGIACLAVALALILWSPWEGFYFFPPTNYQDCKERAARTARSNEAMRIIIGVCYSKFPS